MSVSVSVVQVLPFWDPGEEAARHEACLKLSEGGEKVAKFACRAAGEGVGEWRREGGSSRCALSDPYAKPDDRFTEVFGVLKSALQCLSVFFVLFGVSWVWAGEFRREERSSC